MQVKGQSFARLETLDERIGTRGARSVRIEVHALILLLSQAEGMVVRIDRRRRWKTSRSDEIVYGDEAMKRRRDNEEEENIMIEAEAITDVQSTLLALVGRLPRAPGWICASTFWGSSGLGLIQWGCLPQWWGGVA